MDKPDLETLKLAGELLNSKNSPAYKCFRHQLQPTEHYCRLCEAKKEGNGRIEYARLIFIKGNYD